MLSSTGCLVAGCAVIKIHFFVQREQMWWTGVQSLTDRTWSNGLQLDLISQSWREKRRAMCEETDKTDGEGWEGSQAVHAKKEKKFLFESQITSVDLGIALTRSGHKSFVFVDTEMQKMDRKGEALLDKPAVTALHLFHQNHWVKNVASLCTLSASLFQAGVISLDIQYPCITAPMPKDTLGSEGTAASDKRTTAVCNPPTMSRRFFFISRWFGKTLLLSLLNASCWLIYVIVRLRESGILKGTISDKRRGD